MSGETKTHPKATVAVNSRRRSWYPGRERAGGGRMSRRLRRGGVVLLMIALLGWLGLLLLEPFRHPDVHLACLSGGDYRVLRAPPIAFAAEDIAALVPLENAMYTDGSRGGPVLLTNLDSRAQMQTLGIDLENLLVGRSDVLILYVSAHGISDRGVAYLLCHDFDPTSDSVGRYRVADLLSQLRASSATTKLLILDAGRTSHDPRLGVFANQFPRLLKEDVESLDDPTLWVLGSNWQWERSHVSNSLARSVFGYFVARGLQGSADLDGDESVDLDELHRFVSANVSKWVQELSGGNETQTPVLCWGGGPWRPADGNPSLMSVSRLDEELRAPDLSAAVREARADSRSRSFRNLNVPSSGNPPKQASWQRLPPRASAQFVRVNQRILTLNELKDQQANDLKSNVRAATGDARSRPQAALRDAQAGEPVTSAQSSGDATATTEADPTTTTTQGGDAETAPAATAEEESAAPSASSSSSKATAPQLIMRGWQLRDRLESRAGGRSSPVDYAPVQWRGFQMWLAETEQLYLAGQIGDARRVAARLRGTLPTLMNLPTAPPPAGSRPGAAQRMAGQFARDTSLLVRPHSLAMARLLARHGGPAVPDKVREVSDALEDFATNGTGESYGEWIAKLDPELDRFSEIRFARRLADLQSVGWADLQFALETHLLASQLAATEPCCLPWISERLLQADRSRLAGQRELTDRIGPERSQQATLLLRAAYDAYREAADDAALIQDATFAARDLLHRAPHYVHWHALAGLETDDHAPSFDELAGLLQTLLKLNVALESPAPDALSKVRVLHDSLLRWQQRVERGLQPAFVATLSQPPPAAGDAWRVEVLLSSPLPAAATRLTLLGVANGIDGRMASTYEMAKVPPQARPPQPTTAGDWRLLRQRAELELHLARLALSDGNGSATELSVAEDALTTFLTAETSIAGGDQAVWTALTALNAALEELYRSLPTNIEATILDCRDLSDPATRWQRLVRLRAAERAWRMMDGRDAAAASELNPRAQLFDAEMYDLLSWQAQRYQLTAADASGEEAVFYGHAARDSLATARRIDGQPPIAPVDLPVLQFSGPTSISLTTQPEQTIDIKLNLLGVAEAETWLQMRYDPQLIDVVTPREVTIYRQIPITPAAAYPYDSELLKREPSLRLRAGRSETFRLTVRRRDNSPEPGRIVFKAITREASARHETDVELPVPVATRLVVRGTPGSWAVSRADTVLHPFPNQVTDYQFLLANDLARDKTVGVELIAPGRRANESLPTASLSAEDAARLLDRFGPWESLAIVEEMLVPAGGTPVPIPFPPAPAADEEASAVDAAPNADGLAAALPLSPRIDDGLLLVTTDKLTGRRMVRWIELEPQRPRRYVRPRVGYDLDQQRILIQVSPHNSALIPAAGVNIRAEIVGGLPPATEARLEGQIKSPRFAAQLYADISAGTGRSATIHLWVDDYPRAFIYRIPLDRHATDIPEQNDLLQVRVLAPAEGAAFKTPAGPIPLEFQVDAPPGSFQNGRGLVEVGIDPDRDRDFRGEATVQLLSDRQVELGMSGAGPQGHVAIDTRISDFRLELPAPGVQNARVGVQGRVSAAQRTAWSVPVDIVLDGTPPVVLFQRVQRQPAGIVEVGAPLVVTVPATDHNLSGVAKLEAAFDLAGTGEFSGESPPVFAQRTDDGRWSATLDTAPLASGIYRLLLRATDHVGNEGDYASIRVEVLTAEDAAARRASLTNRLAGTVLWGTRPIRGAQLTLTSDTVPDAPATTADDEGRFLFVDVPPGEYRLTVKGLATGVNRSKELDVTIEPAPARIPPLTIRVDERERPPAAQ